jgi:glucosamine-6-phosphate deaminase
MKIMVCENYEDMSQNACNLVCGYLRKNPKALVSFPGGDTPLGLFRAFVKAVNGGAVDISLAKYVSLDEWVGLGITDEGSCGFFNHVNLLQPLEKPFAETFIINGAAEDIQTERDKLNGFISDHGPIGVSVLGIGLNGHVGFNEEGTDAESHAFITDLAPTTRTVMKKYFGNQYAPTQGITQGLGQILAADMVILIANGTHKTEILQKALYGPVTSQVPASLLQNHANVYVVTDKEALSAPFTRKANDSTSLDEVK